MCVAGCRDAASETVTECVMVERELKARHRALMSILCDRAATSLNVSLTDDFVAEFCCSVAHNVLRYVFQECWPPYDWNMSAKFNDLLIVTIFSVSFTAVCLTLLVGSSDL